MNNGGSMQVREIPGLSKYLIREDGVVISKKTGRALQPVTRDGYLRVGLYRDNGIYGLSSLHRLVAEAFIQGDLTKRVVNHKDGNKRNNAVNNLEIVTHKENSHHAKYVLRRGRVSLSEDDVRHMKILRKRGWKVKEIAKAWNNIVREEAISCAISGKTFKHLAGVE